MYCYCYWQNWPYWHTLAMFDSRVASTRCLESTCKTDCVSNGGRPANEPSNCRDFVKVDCCYLNNFSACVRRLLFLLLSLSCVCVCVCVWVWVCVCVCGGGVFFLSFSSSIPPPPPPPPPLLCGLSFFFFFPFFPSPFHLLRCPSSTLGENCVSSQDMLTINRHKPFSLPFLQTFSNKN